MSAMPDTAFEEALTGAEPFEGVRAGQTEDAPAADAGPGESAPAPSEESSSQQPSTADLKAENERLQQALKRANDEKANAGRRNVSKLESEVAQLRAELAEANADRLAYEKHKESGGTLDEWEQRQAERQKQKEAEAAKVNEAVDSAFTRTYEAAKNRLAKALQGSGLDGNAPELAEAKALWNTAQRDGDPDGLFEVIDQVKTIVAQRQAKATPEPAGEEAPDRAAEMDLAVGGRGGGAEDISGLSSYQMLKRYYENEK